MVHSAVSVKEPKNVCPLVGLVTVMPIAMIERTKEASAVSFKKSLFIAFFINIIVFCLRFYYKLWEQYTLSK